MKTAHFKSKAGYRKWLAYGHIHNVFTGSGERIVIAGHPHKVIHAMSRKRHHKHHKHRVHGYTKTVHGKRVHVHGHMSR